MKKKKNVGLVTTLVLSLASPLPLMGNTANTSIPAKIVQKEQKKPMKNWSDYFDPKTGLLTQKAPGYDGGDTPSHEGFARFCAKLDPTVSFPSPITFQQFTSQVVLPSGKLIRNPVNYNNPNDSSKDQYRGIVVAAIANRDHQTVMELGQALPRNFLDYPVYPNGDLFTPEDHVMFNRDIMVMPFDYLRVLFADFLTFMGTLILCFWSTRTPGPIAKFLGKFHWIFIANMGPDADGVQRNLRGPDFTSNDLGHFMMCIHGAINRPTFLNRLSRWVYGKFRPNGIQWAFDSYFGDDNDPPVNTLTPNLVQRYFK